MNKKIMGLTVAAMMTASVCFASGEMPDEYKIGETVKLSNIQTLSKDEMATTFVHAGSIYRCNTKDGKVMQVDRLRLDGFYHGVTIGGAAYQVPDGGKLISESSWNGMVYFVYEMPDGSILRLNTHDGVVQSISQIINNI